MPPTGQSPRLRQEPHAMCSTQPGLAAASPAGGPHRLGRCTEPYDGLCGPVHICYLRSAPLPGQPRAPRAMRLPCDRSQRPRPR
eukprot:scaffold118228_cov69-Phaeocystis_antarctica.AAC.1